MAASLLELLVPSVCPGCDAPRLAGEPRLCAPCASALRRLDSLGRVITAFAYEGTGARLIQRFKYEGRSDALEVIAQAVLARLQGLAFDAIVPLPRHPGRVRALGYDPAWELARRVSRETGTPLMARVLRRSRRTPPQTGLTPAERRTNVRGSFRAREGSLRGRVPLLLDDVTTTGATLAEAARSLVREARSRPPLRVAAAGTPPLSGDLSLAV